jgi:hypothetical protein
LAIPRHRHRQSTTVFLEGHRAVPSVVRLAWSAAAIPLNLEQIARRRASINLGNNHGGQNSIALRKL